MRLLIAVALAAIAIQSSTVPAAPVPVLVELFTSEGCSSCPPADRLLSDLVTSQPIAGVQVIGLGFHVDYWDDLGWKDGASLHDATVRQQRYARALGSEVYTPLAVVGGRAVMVGSDASALKHAIEKVASTPAAHLRADVHQDGSTLVVDLSASDLPADAREPLDAGLVISEDDVTTVVKRGENSGRTLHHDGVVRAVAALGTISADQALHSRLTLPKPWSPKMHAVAFVQGHKTQRIWGARIATVHSPPVP